MGRTSRRSCQPVPVLGVPRSPPRPGHLRTAARRSVRRTVVSASLRARATGRLVEEGDDAVAKPRRLTERRGWAFAFVVGIVKPLLLGFTRRTWIAGERTPSYGGAVVAANHTSHLDPLTFAHFLYDQGRLPR